MVAIVNVFQSFEVVIDAGVPFTNTSVKELNTTVMDGISGSAATASTTASASTASHPLRLYLILLRMC